MSGTIDLGSEEFKTEIRLDLQKIKSWNLKVNVGEARLTVLIREGEFFVEEKLWLKNISQSTIKILDEKGNDLLALREAQAIEDLKILGKRWGINVG